MKQQVIIEHDEQRRLAKGEVLAIELPNGGPVFLIAFERVAGRRRAPASSRTHVDNGTPPRIDAAVRALSSSFPKFPKNVKRRMWPDDFRRKAVGLVKEKKFTIMEISRAITVLGGGKNPDPMLREWVDPSSRRRVAKKGPDS
jgi:hypothetical protein